MPCRLAQCGLQRRKAFFGELLQVGVCGRTGCGKSTLMMTLFRIVEPSSGSIVVDGVDICGIGLFDLRSRLALVPQVPIFGFSKIECV